MLSLHRSRSMNSFSSLRRRSTTTTASPSITMCSLSNNLQLIRDPAFTDSHCHSPEANNQQLELSPIGSGDTSLTSAADPVSPPTTSLPPAHAHNAIHLEQTSSLVHAQNAIPPSQTSSPAHAQNAESPAQTSSSAHAQNAESPAQTSSLAHAHNTTSSPVRGPRNPALKRLSPHNSPSAMKKCANNNKPMPTRCEDQQQQQQQQLLQDGQKLSVAAASEPTGIVRRPSDINFATSETQTLFSGSKNFPNAIDQQQQQQQVTWAESMAVHYPPPAERTASDTPPFGAQRSSSVRRTRQELQVTVTMMAAFLAFVACWLPLEIAIYGVNAGVLDNGKSVFVQIGLALSLANSGINVLIYSWRYAAFRKALVSMLTGDGRRRVSGNEEWSAVASGDGCSVSSVVNNRTNNNCNGVRCKKLRQSVFFHTVVKSTGR